MTAPEQRVRTFYPSRLDTWTTCPRQYRWRYLEEPPQPRRGAWAHTTMGAAVHTALARWWQNEGPQASAGTVAAGVAEAWSDAGFADRAMAQRWLDRAQHMVAAYVAAETARRAVLVPYGLVEPRRVESSVALRVGDDLVLAGRPDRVDERPGPAWTGAPVPSPSVGVNDDPPTELVVVDYKTGRREPTADDARTSRTLAIYAAGAAAVLRRPATRVELHHVPTGAIATWRHDEQSRDRQVTRAAAVARDIVRAEAELSAGGEVDRLLPPRTGPLCAWCDYRDSCPEGGQAAEPALPWEALEPSTGAVQEPGETG